MRLSFVKRLIPSLLVFFLFVSASENAHGLKNPDYLSFKTDEEANTIEIYKKASRSVVYVTNVALRRDFFSLNVHQIPQGSGSGFIWDDTGLVVTNYHVVHGASRVTITLYDHSNWDAKVVGLAPSKDIAVLRIDAPRSKITPLPRGNSAQLEVGRKVLAIGNPFGLDTTLTVGVVSAVGREIDSMLDRKIHNVIQTDAAINPGNSGGPLLNSLGQLIGINTAIFSPSGTSVGIGFAIPVNTVKKIVPQLIKHGRIIRPIMGIEPAPDNWAQQYDIKGVPLLRVTPNYPAARAGMIGVHRNFRGDLVFGDIIVAINQKPVVDNDSLLTILEEHKPGDTVTVTTKRDNRTREFEVTLIEPR